MITVKQLIHEINSIGFWKVLFSWNRIKKYLIDSFFDIQKLLDIGEQNQIQLEKIKGELNQSEAILNSTKQRISELQTDKASQAAELSGLRDRIRQLDSEVINLKKTDEVRYTEHQKSVQALVELKESVVEEKRLEKEAKEQAILDRVEYQKSTWQRHQQDVKNKMMLLCEKHTIQYLDEVPFKGEPDNTIEICNQFQVLDSKSPRGEDLSNFPTYISKEAQAAKKYAEKKDVRPDIYFVVPSNTLEVLTQTVFEYERHRVFVIPIEALEPTLLNLKRIEEFEFIQEFSPEDRDAICRIIGRLIHNVKRRVQIDISLGKETMSLASDCERLLPEEIAKEVLAVERNIIINPTKEMKGKEIPLEDLKIALQKIENAATGVGINTGPEVVSINIAKKPSYQEAASNTTPI